MKKLLSFVLAIMMIFAFEMPAAASGISIQASNNVHTFDSGVFTVDDGWYVGEIKVGWNGNGNNSVDVTWTGNEGEVIVTPYTVANNKQTSGALGIKIKQTVNEQVVVFTMTRNNGKTIDATIIVPAFVYKVAYFTSGGVFPSTGEETTWWQPVLWGEEIFYPAEEPVRDGYVFSGWKTQSGIEAKPGMTYAQLAGNNSTVTSESVWAQWMTYDEQAISLLSIDATMESLSILSRDIGVRLRGTPGEEKAIDWLINEFEKVGLETEKHAFTASTATQNKAFITIHNPDQFYGLGTFDNGKGGPYMQWHGNIWEAGAAANGYFTGTDEKISGEIVFVGDVGTSPTQDQFYTANVEGKIALIGVNANATMVTRAMNAGAIGLMGFTTSLGGRGNHAQAANPTVTAGTSIPVMGLARCQGEWLMAMLQKDTVTVDIQTQRFSTPYSWNAIGIKPAKNNPDTAPIFMITGHIDSVLGAPGANDNASGVAVTLEAARALSQLDTDNVEIRFVGFGHEESGLRGSNQYVARMDAEERARIKGVFNMDMTGSQDEERATYWCMMTTNGVANLVTDTFIASAGRLGYGEFVQLGMFSSSDHVSFANAGIPAAMGMWFGKPEGYTGQITPSNYTIEAVYHTPLDTIEDNVSEARIKMCIEVVTVAVYDMARNYVAPLFAPASAAITAPEDADTYILTGEYIDKLLQAEAAAEEAKLKGND